jgi:hypothetical protein
VYGGDTNFLGSISRTVNDNIEQYATYTQLGSSVNPVVKDQPVTYTATVYASTSNAGTPPAGTVPTGSVDFYDGDLKVATVPVSAGSGTLVVTAKWTATYAAAGSHAIKAVYSGDANFSQSISGALTERVSDAKTAANVYLSSSANPGTVGKPVTLAVYVGGASGTNNSGATGNVTLTDGTTTLFSGPLDATGKFSYTTSSLAAGTHLIVASYGGDANFTSGVSPTLTEKILAASTVSLVSSLNPALSGQAVTLTATVSAAVGGTGTPTGTVDFRDGSVDLTPGGVAADPTTGLYTFTSSTLALGSHKITAIYSGDGTFAANYASLTEVVRTAPKTLTPMVLQAAFANWGPSNTDETDS